jgi:acyl carrier protein
MSQIADEVRRIVANHFGIAEANLTPDVSFINDLDADSLDAVELTMAFEEAFVLEIPQDVGTTLSTLREATHYIEERKGASPH